MRTQAGITEYAALKVVAVPKSKSEYESVEYSLKTAGAADEFFEKKKRDILKEVSTMQQLKGTPNIVDIDDWAIVEKENGPGWYIYIRMELLTPLFTKYRDGSIKEEDVVELGIDICTALAHCEKRAFIHRDIKPGNILVNDVGEHKLTDFGIARTLDHTTAVTGVGTPGYMSPEVYTGADANKTVDIYSLGLVMYELLNDRRLPFVPRNATPRDESAAMTRRMSGEKIPDPLNGSRALKDIVLKACEYLPENRYANAKEMLKALQKLERSGAAEQKEEEHTSGRQSGSGRKAANAGFVGNAGRDSMAWEDASRTVGADDYVNRKRAADDDLNKTSGSGIKPKKKPEADPKPQPGPKPKQKIDKKFFIIAAVVVALIAGIAASGIFSDSGSLPDDGGTTIEPEPEPETETETETETSEETESGSMYFGGYFDPSKGSMVKDPDLYTRLDYEYVGDEIEKVSYEILPDTTLGNGDEQAAAKKLATVFQNYADSYSGRSTLEGDYDFSCRYNLNDGSSELYYSKSYPYVEVSLNGESWDRDEYNPIQDITVNDTRLKLVESAGRMGFSSNYNDIHSDPDRQAQSQYKVGNVYKLQDDMNVRKGPGTSYDQVNTADLTADAKKHAVKGKKACLRKGTEVTCLEVQDDWMRIPSGWVCIRYGDEVYIK